MKYVEVVEVQATRSFISAVGEFRLGVRYLVDSSSEPVAGLIAGGYLSITCEGADDGAVDSSGAGSVSGDRVDVGVSRRKAQKGAEAGEVDGTDRAEPVGGDRDSAA